MGMLVFGSSDSVHDPVMEDLVFRDLELHYFSTFQKMVKTPDLTEVFMELKEGTIRAGQGGEMNHYNHFIVFRVDRWLKVGQNGVKTGSIQDSVNERL